ncbi:hypothetical protein T484DRAFT_1761890, partial [Baffinella frigidus]
MFPDETVEETTTPPPLGCGENGIYTLEGCCCRIPFEYGGETYTNCTDMDHTAKWCYHDDEGCGFKEKASGEWWGHCSAPPNAT